MVAEFDRQWKDSSGRHIEYLEYNSNRVNELLKYVQLPPHFFAGKKCLDVGCGIGRLTYAMQELGATVDAFDLSPEAIEQTHKINPNAKVYNLLDLVENRVYDFVLCCGVLHHLPDTLVGFNKVASQVKQGGILHIMVYNRECQGMYEYGRLMWQTWNDTEKITYCKQMAVKNGGGTSWLVGCFKPTI